MKKRQSCIGIFVILIMIMHGTNLFGMSMHHNHYVETDFKRAMPNQPAPPTTQTAPPKTKKKKRNPVVLPTFDDNAILYDVHEARLQAIFPDIKEVIERDDASAARVKSCGDCGGKCPTCSAYDRVR